VVKLIGGFIQQLTLHGEQEIVIPALVEASDIFKVGIPRVRPNGTPYIDWIDR
jgi:hypothetical protein